ncbi:DUF4974 domain-containing protein [Halosquirtibacter laminarini]|uniref:DUF4974 domain-containing protein n=1 Tax=Halosquirtibacter laminarini TaxID=3374600 RepID=A0AC61NLC8_9BACT|nr:DUF4974 domain-containing protein [Prolixibacteraceae bacterium]
MNKKQIFNNTNKNKSIEEDETLRNWILSSKANREKYIKVKNLQALYNDGSEYTKFVLEGLNRTHEKIEQRRRNITIYQKVFSYVAIFIIALISGYLIPKIFDTKQTNSEVLISETYVAKGSRSQITLPDGSKVWLNNGSKLIYPSSFNKKHRDVELVGEGFFDIVHNKDIPFVIKVEDNNVQVLGTKFLLKAYPTDPLINIDLVSGSVCFNQKKSEGDYDDYMLTPNHRLTLNKEKEAIQIKQADLKLYDFWTKGTYSFRQTPFRELVSILNQLYGVQIEIKGSALKERKFTGSFSVDDSIDKILDVFKKTSVENSFDYIKNDNKIYIKINQ